MTIVKHIANVSTRTIRALGAIGISLALVSMLLIMPENYPLPSCEFHALTGLSCLTCGLTRSFHAMLLGELSSAFSYHLMGPLIVLSMIVTASVLAYEAVSGRRLHFATWKKRHLYVMTVFMIVWLAYWGIRLITELTA